MREPEDYNPSYVTDILGCAALFAAIVYFLMLL